MKNTGKKALHFAAQQGNTQAIIQLLDLGADRECVDYFGKTPLLAAACTQYNAMVLLLERGAHALAQDKSRMTALHWAAHGGNVPAIMCLINEHGLAVNAISEDGTTALHYAAAQGHLEAVNVLMAHGADANAVTDRLRETALHMAAQRGNVKTICALIKDHGIDPNVVNIRGRPPFHKAVQFAPCADVDATMTALVQNGAHPDKVDHAGYSALHHAVLANKISVIITLIQDYGVDLQRRARPMGRSAQDYNEEHEGMTPLILALNENNCLAAFVLQCAGAQLNKREKRHYPNPRICLASLKTNADKKALLEALQQKSLAPWDPNTIGADHSTALIEAAQNHCNNCAVLLLNDKRTDPNIQDDAGQTALHHVCQNLYSMNSLNLAMLLNLQRTNPVIRDNKNKTARDVLTEHVEKNKDQYNENQLEKLPRLFDLRKMKVQTYLSLKNARCTKECPDKTCTHGPHLPADICMKIARSLTEKSLPKA